MSNVSSSNSQGVHVPKLRFPGFEGEWEEKSMDKIFNEIIEKNRPDLPVLSIQQGVGTVLRDSSDRRISYDKTNLNSYKVMNKGDFIIHLRSFEGGLECSKHQGISSPAYKVLRSKCLVSEAYEDYFRSYNFIQGKLSIAVTGIRDGKSIDMPSFWTIKIAIPKLNEQNKISSFLSLLNKRIEKQRQLVELLKSYKRGFLNSYISQNEPSWEKMRLSDILSERKEYCEKDGTYSHATLSKDGVYGKSDRYDRDYLVSSDDKKYKVTHMGDLCYNPANLKFGVICINTYGDAIFYPIYVTFEISEQHITEFVGAYLMRPDFINQALRFQEGTVYERMAVSPDDLLAMSIHLPPKSEQDKLAKGLSKMQMKIQAEEDVLNKTVLLKKALLSLLFI